MKLLLTSNGFYTDEIKRRFLDLLDADPHSLEAAIITTASPQKEQNRFAKKAASDFEKMGFRKVDWVDVESESPNDLLQKDVIYINGGNPFHLLEQVRKSGADRVLVELAQKDAVIVGVSAGAVLLGPDIRIVHHFTPQLNARSIEDFSALGLTDKRVFPHYDREDLFGDATGRTIGERIREFETIESCSVTRLNDDGYLVVET
ncbi:Type 1 glutamine amidotransferase-like domain-containing protein [Bhargavaea massiliensis]|uniref:Type 1 glutamine amidotransferase-like domain-containing protein n=1 Tax=Bhargavaea massiliensis TaxID=2697500 RepID=UPI001BCDC0CB|nr:Type 1 glutamine amidotransferase-like domain-containing protein [Bhargavaea massiliensis]